MDTSSNVVGEGSAELWGHDRVCFGEGVANDIKILGQLKAHVEVLAALACKQEGELSIRWCVFYMDSSNPKKLVAPSFRDRFTNPFDLGIAFVNALVGRCGPDALRGIEVNLFSANESV